MVREFEGRPVPPARRVAVIVAEVNRFITDRLLDGALDELVRHGVESDQIDVVRVPGSFEIPAAAATALRTGRYDALVALGCVLRGETDHYYFVGREAATGLATLAREHGVGIGFGILTCMTVEQALERSADPHHMGRDAARVALSMSQLLHALRQDCPTARHDRLQPRDRAEAPTRP